MAKIILDVSSSSPPLMRVPVHTKLQNMKFARLEVCEVPRERPSRLPWCNQADRSLENRERWLHRNNLHRSWPHQQEMGNYPALDRKVRCQPCLQTIWSGG
mmetsp:Transcript_87382/g.168162  ORF Transcript_87382/g.168162 Transcript_87382/m.168162 type:complete len:101 (+) Transcript_87382:115-417(+)